MACAALHVLLSRISGGGREMSPHELPLIDYDLPADALPHGIRSLDAEEIQQLLDYERQHNNRVQVVKILEDRLQELREEASPSGGA